MLRPSEINAEFAKKILERVESNVVSDILKVPGINSENLIAIFGAEIEFYGVSIDILDLKKNVDQFAEQNNIPICGVDMEHGPGQYEISIGPYDSALSLGDDMLKLKEFLINAHNADFSAKPRIELPGSGMHFHISMYDESGVNLFAKSSHDMPFPQIFYYAVGGVLDTMCESMAIFAPTENCYERVKYLNMYGQHKYYPVNCSWGINNRTCAIRIPSSTKNNIANTRIEHRVPSSVADPYLCMASILYGISYGIAYKIWPQDPIFGDAFDIQYRHLQSFPKDLQTAIELFQYGRIKDIFSIHHYRTGS